MVISAETSRPPPDPMPPTRTEPTQSHLHNFSFPILKKWGSQRVLRCLNVNRKGEAIRSPSISRSDDEPLDRVREKLLSHLREAEDRFKLPPVLASSPSKELVAPWNLRTRRTPVKDPTPPDRSREEKAAPHVRTVRLRSTDAERKERQRFSITLTKEEIDEDIYAVTGSRARARPKKRPRNVQKQLDMLFPGAWLTEITADSYKVPD